MQQEPRLDRPGAGLPFYERLIIKYYYVGFQFGRMKWEDAIAFFEKETAKLCKLLEPLTAGQAATKVLVARVRGLEDSSRYWSPGMVAEHLVIVATGMSQLIIQLSQGRKPPVEVDIAKVKPLGEMYKGAEGRAIARDLDSKMKGIVAQLARDVKDRASPLKHHHPWFGPITAHQWNCVMAGHQRIHRIQLKRVIEGMPAR